MSEETQSVKPSLTRSIAALVAAALISGFGVFGVMAGLSQEQVTDIQDGVVEGVCPPVEPCVCPPVEQPVDTDASE